MSQNINVTANVVNDEVPHAYLLNHVLSGAENQTSIGTVTATDSDSTEKLLCELQRTRYQHVDAFIQDNHEG